jgi:O-antigen/teichoic acid export membrane protein
VLMFKQFIKDTAVYGLTGIITKSITIFLVPVYTRIFDPTDYGVIDILAIAGSIIGIIVPLQIGQGIARFYPDTKEKYSARLFASTALFFTISMYLFFLLVSLVFSSYFTRTLLENSTSKLVFNLWATSTFIIGIFYITQNQLKWMLKPKSFALASLIYSVVTILFTILLVVFVRIGLVGVYIAQIIGGVIGTLVSFWHSREDYVLKFDTKKLSSMLSYSVPLVPSGVGLFFSNYIHRIMIKGLMTLADLGLFAVGAKVASVVTIIMQGIQGSITPLIYSNYREKDSPEQIAKIFRYFVFGALNLTVLLSVFAKEILIVLTTPLYYSAFVLAPFLVFDRFLSSGHIFTPGLYLAKKTKTITVINLIGAAINLCLSYALIVKIGILGAAIGTASSSVFVFVLNMYYSQKYYNIPHNFKILAISLLITILCIALSYIIKSESFWIRIFFKVGLFLINFLFLIKIRLISSQEIKTNFSKLRRMIIRKVF